jgi:hypothetical protein
LKRAKTKRCEGINQFIFKTIGVVWV